MSEVIEDFGIEEFGSPTEAPEPTTDDPGELKELIDELTKQSAEMDAGEQKDRIRAIKKAAQERLDSLVKATTKSESQWTELSLAFAKFFGNRDEFQNQLAAAGGVSSEAFEKLRHALAEAHAAKKPKATRAKKDKAPITEPLPTPESRLEHIRLHAKNLGFNADAVMTEMGITTPTDGNMGDLLREINHRANPQTEVVEEFGMGELLRPSPVASDAEKLSTTVMKPVDTIELLTDASGSLIWDERIKELIDPETGEVMERTWILKKLGLPDFPTEPSEEVAAKIVDIIHTYYLDPAARYRRNADELASPLEQRAAEWDKVFGPYLDACGNKFLPRFKKDSAPTTKDPHKAGDFSAKTLKLITGSISWTKDGGVKCINEAEWYVWLGKQKQHMQELIEKGDPDSLEELESLARTYGLKLETKAVADKEKIKQLGALPPGWGVLEVDEFAKRVIK